MALRISRRLWTRGRPLCSGVGRCPSRYAHSASERSVRYGFLMCLMHARVATQIPDYPFSDSFMTEFSQVDPDGWSATTPGATPRSVRTHDGSEFLPRRSE